MKNNRFRVGVIIFSSIIGTIQHCIAQEKSLYKSFLIAGGSDGDDAENQFFRGIAKTGKAIENSDHQLTLLYDGKNSRDENFLRKDGIKRDSWDYRSILSITGSKENSASENTAQNILNFLDNLDKKAKNNPSQILQAIIFFDTHGTAGKHSLSVGDRDSLSTLDPELHQKLNNLRNNNQVKLGIIDNSCYGGASIPNLKKYGCILSSQVSSAVSCGNNVGESLANLLSKKESNKILLPGNSKLTMEELFITSLLNPMQDNVTRKDNSTCLLQPQLSGYDDHLSQEFNRILQLDPPNSNKDTILCGPTKAFSEINHWVQGVEKITRTDLETIVSEMQSRVADNSDIPWLNKAFRSLTGTEATPQNLAEDWRKKWDQLRPKIENLRRLQEQDRILSEKINSLGAPIKTNIILKSQNEIEAKENLLIGKIIRDSNRYRRTTTSYSSSQTEIHIDCRVVSEITDPKKVSDDLIQQFILSSSATPSEQLLLDRPSLKAKLLSQIQTIETNPQEIVVANEKLKPLNEEYKKITAEFKIKSNEPEFRKLRIDINSTLSKLRAYHYLAEREKLFKTPDSKLSSAEIDQKRQLETCRSIEL